VNIPNYRSFPHTSMARPYRIALNHHIHGDEREAGKRSYLHVPHRDSYVKQAEEDKFGLAGNGTKNFQSLIGLELSL
jgi:hypothetical protein